MRILHGDCRNLMADMDEASVDSIVTDPPYELGFMGRAWDSSGVAFDPDTWRAALRVLKPGGHLLAFGGSRTYHRMACAIEDAGFDIRDQIMWLYASGFPKSKNIGDGRGTALKPAHEPIVLARKPLTGTIAANVLAHGTGGINIEACRVETGEAVKTFDRQAGDRPRHQYRTGTVSGPGFMVDRGRWPANVIHDGSPDVLAGFPASNSGGPAGGPTFNHHFGPGAADGGAPGRTPAHYGDTGSAARFFYCAKASKGDRDEGLNSHRLICLEAKWEGVDLNLRLRVDTAQYPPRVIAVSGIPGSNAREWSMWLFGNEFTAPLLAGCKFTTETKINLITACPIWSFFARWITSANTVDASCVRECGGSHAENVKTGFLPITITSGSTVFLPNVGPVPSEAQLRISVDAGRSDHPTVKPEALMRYLCRMITPSGGIVLDPFAGSGSTGKAAVLEGFRFIGCELTAEYLPIAQARIAAAEARVALHVDLFSEAVA